MDLTPYQGCDACGDLLVTPLVAGWLTVPKETEYVCIHCCCPYRWAGNPRRLVAILSSDTPLISRRLNLVSDQRTAGPG
jgi:hypothetical protein